MKTVLTIPFIQKRYGSSSRLNSHAIFEKMSPDTKKKVKVLPEAQQVR
jgi:hypothetical protein